MENKLLTIKETAKLLSIKESTLRSAVFKKTIPYIKVGRLVRFDIHEIKRFLEDNSISKK